MSILEDFMDISMTQDASNIFDRSEKDSLRETLREEWLSMDEDENLIASQKGMGFRL